MGLEFSNKILYGVSLTPDKGIEVAQIDYANRTLMNYVVKPFAFDAKMSGTGLDLDIFKETLYDALVDIGAPQGSEIVLNLPSTIFKIKDWPASMDQSQIINNIEDEIAETPQFQSEPGEPSYSYCILPNSTLQFNKIVYTALHKSLVMEIAVQIRDLKYKLVAIDTSLNSTLNALIYSGRIEVAPETSWVMLVVDGNYCRVIPMQGRSYVDCMEERINIGKVLGDDENYATVLNAANPVLKNTPSSLLYVVSKTDIISAKRLADKLEYKSQIVHQEDNVFNEEPILNLSSNIDDDIGKTISLDVIGAGIRKSYGKNSVAPINMFNWLLGDVYTSQVPPVVNGVELSMENMLKLGISVAVCVLAIAFCVTYIINKATSGKEAKIQEYNREIETINKFLEENKEISSKKFSEAEEISNGLISNKNLYSYYTIVGTEIPKKLWLTSLEIGEHVDIQGQADNLESVYGFFRNIKDYNPNSEIKLQRLGLAGKSNSKAFVEVEGESNFDTESILTTLNADCYEFRISDVAEPVKKKSDKNSEDGKSLPNLEPIE